MNGMYTHYILMIYPLYIHIYIYYELGSATWGITGFLSYHLQAAASQLLLSTKARSASTQQPRLCPSQIVASKMALKVNCPPTAVSKALRAKIPFMEHVMVGAPLLEHAWIPEIYKEKQQLKWAHSHSQQLKFFMAWCSFHHLWFWAISFCCERMLGFWGLHGCREDSNALDVKFHVRTVPPWL